MPYDTVQNRKTWFIWYLMLKAFTCTSIWSTEPHSLSFQGALPLGYWVFRAVDYPVRYALIIHIFRDYGKNKTTTTFAV